MPYFPLFVNLTGRLCVVAGGGAVAARKARALIDFEARVTILDPEPREEILRLAGRGSVTLLRRSYTGPEDLAEAALVIAATDNPGLNKLIAQDARAAGTPVNAADDPQLCSFFFPALVRRGNLVAGISTSGDCPRLAARLRENLEAEWPSDLGETLEILKTERRRIKESADSAGTIRRLDLLISRFLEKSHGR
jgi:siroheme synthase-like protein